MLEPNAITNIELTAADKLFSLTCMRLNMTPEQTAFCLSILSQDDKMEIINWVLHILKKHSEPDRNLLLTKIEELVCKYQNFD